MNMQASSAHGQLQRVVDMLFKGAEEVRRLDVLIMAESLDIHPDLLGIVNLLPPGTYTRNTLTAQLNSAISGNGWGYVYGTVV